MSLNRLKFWNFLLAAGLLAVLVLGLTEVPELQDYLFPTRHLEVMLRSAKKGCLKIEENLTSLRARLAYLEWFLAPGASNQKVSWDRIVSFPFSEGIRQWSPHFFLEINLYLAKRGKVNVERRLKYLDALLYRIDSNIKKIPPCDTTEPLSRQFRGIIPSQQNQKFHQRWLLYNRGLNELTDQLTSLGDNIQNK